MNPLDLARPEIRAMQAYSSARMEVRGGSVRLDANESPWPPFGGGGWNRYPDPQPAALVASLAALYGVATDQLLAGRGSDEGIDLLVRAFCRAGRDAVLISPPTFGMYAVCAHIQGAAVLEAPLRVDFTLDVDAVLAATTPDVKLVFVCAPNNPSGMGVQRSEILRLAKSLAGRALLVVDEAYVEFAEPDGGFGSVAECVGELENLVVLRTLSKAWGLAGARVGSLIADMRTVALLRKLMPPYPLPSPSVDAALRVLTDAGQHVANERIATLLAERTRVRSELAALANVRAVLPSQANFLAVRFQDADAAWLALRDAGVVVRDVRRYPMLGDALRITIGAPPENDRVLEILRGMEPAALSQAHASRAGQPA